MADRSVRYFILACILGLTTVPFFAYKLVKAQTFATTTENVTVSVTVLGSGDCGNGLVDDPSEECDDGNFVNGDGCTDTCLLEFCGDGTLQTGLGEECDDGNNINGAGCDSACIIETAPTSTPPTTSTGTGYAGSKPPSGVISFKGYTSPFAFVRVYKNGSITATIQADQNGDFFVEKTGLPAGVYTWGFSAEDRAGRQSLTYEFTISVVARRKTEVDNIVLPPTISLERRETFRGRNIFAFGETHPDSAVTLVSFPGWVAELTSNHTGYWQMSVPTIDFEIGQHTVKAQTTIDSGYQSPYSANYAFEVLASPANGSCRGPDLDLNGQVNVFDLSLLLYDWEKTNPSLVCSDINVDGIVNLIDFSIMLYWWSG